MKKRIVSLLLILVLVCSLAACGEPEDTGKTPSDSVVITDMMGRQIAVPADTKSNTVASTYGAATPFLATLGISDRVIACNFKNKGFYRRFDDVIVNAGSVGTTITLDQEALAAADPDIYICKISDQPKIEIASRLGIPSITLSAERPEEVMEAYEMLGKAFGAEERAAEINAYLSAQLDEIDKLAATIPEEKKVTALCMGSQFSRVAGEDMLQTIMLQRVGAKTVVDGIVGDEERYWADCGVEKVFELDPQFIFVTSSAVLDFSMDDFYTDSAWSAMSAVKAGNIYQIPAKLDSWDMPGPGYILAMYYMMHRLYPDLVSAETMQEKTDEFYLKLYGTTFDGDDIGYEF